MIKFELENSDYIELNSLLKLVGLCSSGGEAKLLIADGQVMVNGEIELRKRCKIRAGDSIRFAGEDIQVIAGSKTNGTDEDGKTG